MFLQSMQLKNINDSAIWQDRGPSVVAIPL